MHYVFLTRFSYTLFTKTLLLFRISSLKRLLYRRVNTSKTLHGAAIPITLAKNQVKIISVHFFIKKVTFLKLSTVCPKEKSSHKKNHAYLTDSEYFTCLLKKCSHQQHMSQNGHLQACKTTGFFFMIIFLVSSPTSTTTFRFQHS